MLDRPIRIGSPCSSSSSEGTVESGIRSENDDSVLGLCGRRDCGGDEEIMPVDDVRIGVGYLCISVYFEGETRATRLAGRGREGDEEKGSNAGKSDGAERFTPMTGEIGSVGVLPGGEESIVPNIKPAPGREQDGFRIWRVL